MLFHVNSHGLGCLHTRTPAQSSVTPLAVKCNRKHFFLQNVKPPRKALRESTRIAAVDEEQRNTLSEKNQQAGARTCKGLHRPKLLATASNPRNVVQVRPVTAKTLKSPD